MFFFFDIYNKKIIMYSKSLIKKILQEGLNLPKKDLSTPDLWLKDLFSNFFLKKHPKYPNTIGFYLNNEIYMRYDKNSEVLFYDYYKIELVLRSKYSLSTKLNDNQIKELIKNTVKEYFNLKVYATIRY